MDLFLQKLGWPEHAADEKGVLRWAAPKGNLVATLTRSPKGVECKVVSGGGPEATSAPTVTHLSRWSLDGHLEAFSQYGEAWSLNEDTATQAFTGVTRLLGQPGYTCMGRLPAMAPPETPSAVSETPRSRRSP